MSEKLPSTKPYLVRAIHEWCTDNGFTPHVTVDVNERVRVPREHVRNGRIVLNIGHEATGDLQIGNDLICFKARFGGVAHDISFPVGYVAAIYARENGVGMAFEPEAPGASGATPGDDPDSGPGKSPPGGRPKLQRIK
jgi:stringent starvation protein B